MREYKKREASYPSDLTDAQWSEIEPLFSELRQYRWPKRELMNAVLYFVKTGCQLFQSLCYALVLGDDGIATKYQFRSEKYGGKERPKRVSISWYAEREIGEVIEAIQEKVKQLASTFVLVYRLSEERGI